jgi:hypothetical protein
MFSFMKLPLLLSFVLSLVLCDFEIATTSDASHDLAKHFPPLPSPY